MSKRKRPYFSRALVNAQSIGLLIASVTINRNLKKKPKSIQEQTAETQPYSSESFKILYAKITSISLTLARII